MDEVLSGAPVAAHRFYTVPEAARLLRVSAMTLYRSIAAGEFPAVRVRTRLLVPAVLIDGLTDAALRRGAAVDIAEWRTFSEASGGPDARRG